MKTYALWDTSESKINPTCSSCGRDVYRGKEGLNPPTDVPFPDKCSFCGSEIAVKDGEIKLPFEVGSKAYFLGHGTPVVVTKITQTEDMDFEFECVNDESNSAESGSNSVKPITGSKGIFLLSDIGKYVFETKEEALSEMFFVYSGLFRFSSDKRKLSLDEFAEKIKETEDKIEIYEYYATKIFSSEEADAYADSLEPRTTIGRKQNGQYPFTAIIVSRSCPEKVSFNGSNRTITVKSGMHYFEAKPKRLRF